MRNSLISSIISGAVVNKMPGTADFSDERYAEYISSQYDVIAGEFPDGENEAVLVIGGGNDATDLLLAQLGLLEEYKFLSLFEQGENDSDEYMTIDFDDIVGKQYTLFFNDSVYSENDSGLYPFTYNGEKTSLSAGGDGIEITVSGILRLKERAFLRLSFPTASTSPKRRWKATLRAICSRKSYSG